MDFLKLDEYYNHISDFVKLKESLGRDYHKAEGEEKENPSAYMSLQVTPKSLDCRHLPSLSQAWVTASNFQFSAEFI